MLVKRSSLTFCSISNLMAAAEEGKLDEVQELLEKGADISEVTDKNWTALDFAAICVKPTAGKIIELLVNAGAQVDRDSGGWATPMMKACWRGHVSAIKALIACGANVNQVTYLGTPLLFVLRDKKIEFITALLAGGADTQLRYEWKEKTAANEAVFGKTPLEMATKLKSKKLIDLLSNPELAKVVKEFTAAEIPSLWKQLEKAMKKSPRIKKSLAKGATEEECTKLADQLGVTLPDDFKASYLIHNGQKDEPDADDSFVPEDWLNSPYYLMKLDEIIREWKLWKSSTDSGEFKGNKSSPDEGIQPVWWHEGWIPFCSDGGGDFLCIDLAPTDKGKYGQVITMCHASPRRQLIANSLADFLGLLVDRWA